MASVTIQHLPKFPRAFFKNYSSVAVLADETTRVHCYEKVKGQLPKHHLIVIPPGERHKNLEICRLVWQQLTEAELDRHSLLVVIGGGVAGDLGGFCASTFKRGIDFVLIPTTLLSMADSSIGGKTGIDFGSIKNHLGTFAMPKATWVVTSFLDTLPTSELRSGFAEIVKHAILSDRKLWNSLRKKSLEQQDWRNLIKHSNAFKSSIVKKDPKEIGLRKVLNFGHTIGHALEGQALQTEKPILHGEAVAAGMIMESYIGLKKKLLKESEFDEIRDFILKIFGRIDVPPDESWMATIRQDKKNKGKKILMALPRGIGKAVFDISVTESEIRAATVNYRENQM